MPRITLVTGPPCSGKTTWVQRHAQPGDLIVCFDQHAIAAGSRHPHNHTAHQLHEAGESYRRALEHLATEGHDGNAWVIRCAPTAAERVALSTQVQATDVLVLKPPREVTLQRARNARRARRTYGAIHGWYLRYQPVSGHTVIGAVRAAAPAW
jgi:predicted kinase